MSARVTSARFILPVDLYSVDLYVSLGEQDARFAQGLLRYKDQAWVDECVETMRIRRASGVGRLGRKMGFFLLRLGVFPVTAEDYGTLQHEIFHFAESLFDQIGMPHSYMATSEAYAHLIGFVTEKMYETINQFLIN